MQPEVNTTILSLPKQAYLRHTELQMEQMGQDQLREFAVYLLKSYLVQEAMYQQLLLDNSSFLVL